MLNELLTAIKNADIYSLISILITAGVLIFVCLPSHEFAHAWAADKLGDSTAKYQGRLTLNPFKHIDPIGAAMMLLIGVGYAKPVPVNMMNFKNRKRDMALTALAGPLMNLFFGIIFMFFEVLFIKLANNNPALILKSEFTYQLFNIILFVFTATSQISISLAIFNLIPIPPFDGSRILGFFLPDRIYYKLMQYEQIIFIVVMVALWCGFLSGPLSSFIDLVYNGLFRLISQLFGGVY